MAVSANDPLGHFDHGGTTFGVADAVDFSASLNPLGMPAAALDALRDNVRAFEEYPDVRNRALVDAVAAFEGVDARRISMCAGATDAFDRIVDVLAPRCVLLLDPCFSGYERALRRSGAQVEHVALDAADDFDFTECVLAAACDLLSAQGQGCGGRVHPDLVFLCTPNNPTGRTVGLGFLRSLLVAAAQADATVVLDECFADLADLDSAVPLQEEFPNLIVVKAFTKTFAMAGLRVGYAICADSGLACKLDDSGAQWAVSVPAQIAGTAALQDPTYLERTHAYVPAERARLEEALAEAGMRVVPSHANFILFQERNKRGLSLFIPGNKKGQSPFIPSDDVNSTLFDQLAARGIIVRRCGNFNGLDDTWYRIAVRTAEENTRFIEALKEVRSA